MCDNISSKGPPPRPVPPPIQVLREDRDASDLVNRRDAKAAAIIAFVVGVLWAAAFWSKAM